LLKSIPILADVKTSGHKKTLLLHLFWEHKRASSALLIQQPRKMSFNAAKMLAKARAASPSRRPPRRRRAGAAPRPPRRRTRYSARAACQCCAALLRPSIRHPLERRPAPPA